MIKRFIKTEKVEGAYPTAFEGTEDVTCHPPRRIDGCNKRRAHTALGYSGLNLFKEQQARKLIQVTARNCPSPKTQQLQIEGQASRPIDSQPGRGPTVPSAFMPEGRVRSRSMSNDTHSVHCL